MITNEEKKLGGFPVIKMEAIGFNHCMNMCDLVDIEFKDSNFTCQNRRTVKDLIFKSLDRVICNMLVKPKHPVLDVEHLVECDSAHAPLLIPLKKSTKKVTVCFRFFNF